MNSPGFGPEAVPWLMERFAENHSFLWEFVLQEVTGLSMIDDSTSFDGEKIYRRRLAWWERERQHWPGV